MPQHEIHEAYCFNCTMCGECCRGDMVVYLNMYDLYKMAKLLEYEHTAELFDNNLVTFVYGQHGMLFPRIRFKQAIITFCPFLINELDDEEQLIGRCRLHPHHKPLICALSPVSRELDLSEGKTIYRLVEPAGNCPGMKTAKKNNLSAQLEHHSRELFYEERFYRILESMKKHTLPMEQLNKDIYYFPVDEDFEKILVSMERLVGLCDRP